MENVRYVFMIGITKFKYLSIFSGTNNFNDYSFVPEYSTICGFKKQEVDTVLKPDVENLAVKLGVEYNTARQMINDKFAK